jgi:thiaminase/transcriptional activator TenA
VAVRLSEEIWTAIAPVHAAILEHPFVAGLTDGSLPEAAFARYVVQDAIYLADYSRALALCAARAGTTADLRMFCLHAAEAIDVERALHERLMAALGIPPQIAATTEPSPTCLAYTSFLLQACALRERHEAVAAVLPCYWIYWEVGRALAGRGSPDPRYRAWIETYAGPEFEVAVTGAIGACDRAGGDLAPAQRAAAVAAAERAATYEWMFWDAALRDERWPAFASA